MAVISRTCWFWNFVCTYEGEKEGGWEAEREKGREERERKREKIRTNGEIFRRKAGRTLNRWAGGCQRLPF